MFVAIVRRYLLDRTFVFLTTFFLLVVTSFVVFDASFTRSFLAHPAFSALGCP